MLLQELIGSTITNVFQVLNYEPYGMDTGECFVELDKKIIIEIPYGFSEEVRIKKLDKKAVSIFDDLSDYPVYLIKNDDKTNMEIAAKVTNKNLSLFEKIKHIFTAPKPQKLPAKFVEYPVKNVEYRENKFKYIKDSVIKDLITFCEEDEKGFFELGNGYFISETNNSMNGTGRIGINLYDSLTDITNWKGNTFKRLSDNLK